MTMVDVAKPGKLSGWDSLAIYFAVPLWISGLVIAALWLPISLISLYYFPAFGGISLALLLVLVTVPLTDKPPLFVDKFLKYSFKITKDYFPITIDYVNRDAFKNGSGPYVIGAVMQKWHAVLCGHCEQYSWTAWSARICWHRDIVIPTQI